LGTVRPDTDQTGNGRRDENVPRMRRTAFALLAAALAVAVGAVALLPGSADAGSVTPEVRHRLLQEYFAKLK
jgi:hypothetical protein